MFTVRYVPKIGFNIWYRYLNAFPLPQFGGVVRNSGVELIRVFSCGSAQHPSTSHYFPTPPTSLSAIRPRSIPRQIAAADTANRF